MSQFLHLSISLNVEDPDQCPTTNPLVDLATSPFFIDQLYNLLSKYADIFSCPTGLPPMWEFDHCIPLLLNTALINVCPYHYSHSQKEDIKWLINKCCVKVLSTQAPVISPGRSSLFGRKMVNGDYPALNGVTVKDRFPIPTIEELLDELADVQVFSKLDLQSGYHQVRMHPSNIEKSAF